MIQLHRRTFLRWLAISGSAVGNDFALPVGEERSGEIDAVKPWIDLCAWLGAPHIRVFAGKARGRSEVAARKLCISALEECSDYFAAVSTALQGLKEMLA